MASKEITCISYISIDGAEPRLISDLSPKEIEYCSKKMSERLSRVMSDYYTAHPDEYIRLSSKPSS